MTLERIISLLPYSHPFLFVDKLNSIDENSVVGTYTYSANSFYYQGHFADYPITPGVILTETMAQIGMVCLGIYLMKDKIETESDLPKMVMVSNETEFYLPVYPGEQVKVISEKIYFRFGKLKCNVSMRNQQNQIVCNGVIAGMLLKQ